MLSIMIPYGFQYQMTSLWGEKAIEDSSIAFGETESE